MVMPSTHWIARIRRSATQGLAIPALTDLGDVVRREPRAPGLTHQASHVAVVRLQEKTEDRIPHRLGRRQRQPAGAARRHHVEDASAILGGRKLPDYNPHGR